MKQTNSLIGGQGGAADRLGSPRTTLIYKMLAVALYFKFKTPMVNACSEATSSNKSRQLIPFFAGMAVSAAIGLVALGYEMVWYRLYSFVSGRSAASFALLLGWYLAGLAYGSLAIRDLCRGRLSSDLPACCVPAG